MRAAVAGQHRMRRPFSTSRRLLLGVNDVPGLAVQPTFRTADEYERAHRYSLQHSDEFWVFARSAAFCCAAF